jgi:hypothetical protein
MSRKTIKNLDDLSFDEISRQNSEPASQQKEPGKPGEDRQARPKPPKSRKPQPEPASVVGVSLGELVGSALDQLAGALNDETSGSDDKPTSGELDDTVETYGWENQSIDVRGLAGDQPSGKAIVQQQRSSKSKRTDHRNGPTKSPAPATRSPTGPRSRAATPSGKSKPVGQKPHLPIEEYHLLLVFVLTNVFQRIYLDLTDRECAGYIKSLLPRHKAFTAFCRKHPQEPPATVLKQFLIETCPDLYTNRTRKDPHDENIDELRTCLNNRRAASRPTGEIPGSFTYGVDTSDLFINVGVDFGTSSIKAVYRIYDEDMSFPIRFSAHSKVSDYTLADSLWIAGEELRFAVQDVGTRIPSLKRSLSAAYGGELQLFEDSPTLNRGREEMGQTLSEIADRPLYEVCEFLTAIYLAFVLYQLRAAIVDDLHGRGEHRVPGLSAYMCVPVYYFEDDAPALLANNAALAAADMLLGLLPEEQLRDRRVGIRDAWRAWQNAIQSTSVYDLGPEMPTQVYPEVTAEAASYWHTKAAVPGRYILVDIGAGTCDVNVFTIIDELGGHSRQSPVLWGEISALGVEELEHRLRHALPSFGRDQAMAELEMQKLTAEGHDTSGVFPTFTSDLHEQYDCENIFQRYIEELGQKLWIAYGNARQKGGLESWADAIIFIGGGGSNLRDIEVIEDVFYEHPVLKTVEVRNLPTPDDFECEDSNVPFHRLSVAYGLSLMLERQTLPFEIPEKRSRHRRRMSIGDRFISKDQV